MYASGLPFQLAIGRTVENSRAPSENSRAPSEHQGTVVVSRACPAKLLSLSEPRGKRRADLVAASRLLDAHLNALVLDYDQGWETLDAAPAGKVRTGPVVDPVELEGVVVSPPLKHLGEETFHPARLP